MEREKEIPSTVLKTDELHYVSDQGEGITRDGSAGSFSYFKQGKKITARSILSRIRSLAIPPAWTNVWICPDPKGHLQATGTDGKGRKQYIYHPDWNELRKQTKFSRLLLFGKRLPLLRKQLHKDLLRKKLCLEKVLATVVSLMEKTCIRVGNNEYERLYGSYGLTTLKDQHIRISRDEVQFSFRGKKAVPQEVKLRDRALARIIKQCRDIPGKELFQYYDKDGNRHSISSGQVNGYIRKLTGENFTAKDFRTWAGTLNALSFFRRTGDPETNGGRQRIIREALEVVSKRLGNTKNICRKYYIHPLLIELFEEGKLLSLPLPKNKKHVPELSMDERMLLTLLQRTKA